MRLGEILIEGDVITPEQLAEALERQKRFGGKIGAVLIELGFASEAEVGKALSQQARVPAVSRAVLQTVPRNVLDIIPHSTAAKYRVVPVRLDGNRLYVATANPGDKATLARIADETRCEVRAMVAPELIMGYILELHYGVPQRPRVIPVAGHEDAPDAVAEQQNYRRATGEHPTLGSGPIRARISGEHPAVGAAMPGPPPPVPRRNTAEFAAVRPSPATVVPVESRPGARVTTPMPGQLPRVPTPPAVPQRPTPPMAIPAGIPAHAVTLPPAAPQVAAAPPPAVMPSRRTPVQDGVRVRAPTQDAVPTRVPVGQSAPVRQTMPPLSPRPAVPPPVQLPPEPAETPPPDGAGPQLGDIYAATSMHRSVPAPIVASMATPEPTPTPPHPAGEVTPAPEPLGLSDLAARFGFANKQTDITEAVLGYLRREFGTVVMVLIRGGNQIAGRRAVGRVTGAEVRAWSAPRETVPILAQGDDAPPRLVRDNGALLGRLVELLGPPGAAPCLILPMRCGGRPVGYFVAVDGNDGVEARYHEYVTLMTKMDMALQILVLRQHIMEQS